MNSVSHYKSIPKVTYGNIVSTSRTRRQVLCMPSNESIKKRTSQRCTLRGKIADVTQIPRSLFLYCLFYKQILRGNLCSLTSLFIYYRTHTVLDTYTVCVMAVFVLITNVVMVLDKKKYVSTTTKR